jgi:ESCRT-II complex subunit VPS25
MDSTQLAKVYDFPPLFTLQPNQSSKRKQLGIWRDILKSRDIYIFTTHSEVFQNHKISRQFDPYGVNELCAFLIEENLGEWLKEKEKFLFFQSPLTVLGGRLLKWIDESGRMGTVETLLSITNEWQDYEEQGVPIELVYRMCKYLEMERKCEVFTDEVSHDESRCESLESIGVKFFGT